MVRFSLICLFIVLSIVLMTEISSAQSLLCTGIENDDMERFVLPLPEAVTMELVHIPAGSFRMGSEEPDWAMASEAPVHTVTLEYDFYLGTHEVTQLQWKSLMGFNPVTDSGNETFGIGDDYPVYWVSWNDCHEFIEALNGLGQGTFRLPSEAEWEYACRGPAGSSNRYARFSFGDSDCDPNKCESCELDKYAWWCGNRDCDEAKPVGRFLPNGYGLFDMHGNVWEWTEDDWHNNYEGAPADGSPWVDSPRSTRRVKRGGHWKYPARFCRSSHRYDYRATMPYYALGLRVVREIE